ncbi:MAG: sigma factor-like helix-turn-helix DNA-binding protein [Rhodobacter sp.]|nr:sigma factor-like helix-turn-helix DNA-binding protein [Rhodobacter sp.]
MSDSVEMSLAPDGCPRKRKGSDKGCRENSCRYHGRTLTNRCVLAHVEESGTSTLDEVASHFSLSRERVRQLEEVALGKLRRRVRAFGLSSADAGLFASVVPVSPYRSRAEDIPFQCESEDKRARRRALRDLRISRHGAEALQCRVDAGVSRRELEETYGLRPGIIGKVETGWARMSSELADIYRTLGADVEAER